MKKFDINKIYDTENNEYEKNDYENFDEEPASENYTVVDVKKKTTVVIAFAVCLVFTFLIFVLNSAMTKPEKSKEVASVTTQVTVEETRATTEAENEITTRPTSAVSQRNTQIFNLYEKWNLPEANACLTIFDDDSFEFEFTDRKITYYGNTEIKQGYAALNVYSLTLDDALSIFHSKNIDFNISNLYYIKCSETSYSKNGASPEKIDSSDEFESSSVFEHLVYIYEDSNGNVKAKYYDDSSSRGLFDLELG